MTSRNQNLFEALQRVCGFTALESDMDEIINAVDLDRGKSESSSAIKAELEGLKGEIEAIQGTLKADRWMTSLAVKSLCDGKIIGLNTAIECIMERLINLNK